MLKEINNIASNIENKNQLEFVTKEQYLNFTKKSRWREKNGYGYWIHFDSPDGTLPTSNKNRALNFKTEKNQIQINEKELISGISFYDAIQYCRWNKVKIPTINQALRNQNSNTEILEWTSEWYNEKKSHIAVIEKGKVIGINPDLRDSKLSFRIIK